MATTTSGRRPIALLAAVAGLLVAAPGAAQARAAAPLATWSHDGNKVTAHLTARTMRRFAHADVDLTCAILPRRSPDGGLMSGQSGTGQPDLEHPDFTVEGDYCVLRIRRTHRRTRRETYVATDAGRRYVASVQAAQTLSAIVSVSTMESPVPTTDRIVAGLPPALPVDALAAPDGTVAEGRYGVWSDGARRIVATATLDGKRWFLDYDAGTEVLSTNALSIVQAPERDGVLRAVLQARAQGVRALRR
jgi:hypothetical protein